jgi:hypothetical protein
MEDIAQGLVKSGIELMMYHSEAAPGQVRSFHLTRCFC